MRDTSASEWLPPTETRWNGWFWTGSYFQKSHESVYIYLYIFVYVCIYIYIFVSIRYDSFVCWHVWLIYIYIFIYICIYIYIFIYLYIYIYLYICIYIYIDIDIYIYNIYIYMYLCDMTHSYAWHDWLIVDLHLCDQACVRWFIRTYDVSNV